MSWGEIDKPIRFWGERRSESGKERKEMREAWGKKDGRRMMENIG